MNYVVYCPPENQTQAQAMAEELSKYIQKTYWVVLNQGE